MKRVKLPRLLLNIYAFNLTNRDKWIKEQSRLVPNNSFVLDVGSGSAPYRVYFSHCQYRTQDFAQLEDHQLRGYCGYNNIDYVSDITNIPVESSVVDAVLCTEVLEHVPDPIKAIEEISRILRSGGVLILTVPLGSGLHQEPYHFYGGYTPYFFHKVLTDFGFDKIEITSNRGFYSLFSQELIRLVRRSAPWRSLLFFCFLPLWLLLLFLAVLMPVLAIPFDFFDKRSDFTVGYHVKAEKK